MSILMFVKQDRQLPGVLLRARIRTWRFQLDHISYYVNHVIGVQLSLIAAQILLLNALIVTVD